VQAQHADVNLAARFMDKPARQLSYYSAAGFSGRNGAWQCLAARATSFVYERDARRRQR